MENVVIRKAILNTVAASGDNVLDVAASGAYPGVCVIVEDHAVTPPVELLPPITKGTCVRATKEASQAEVTQVAVIGMDLETIVASTRYKIEIYCPKEKYMSQHKEPSVYAYTSPAVLASADADRLNVFTILAGKINADSTNHVTAYVMYKVAFTSGGNGGGTDVPAVGTVITQATSGVTAKIAAIDIDSGSGGWNGDAAVGTIWLYDVSSVSSWLSASTASTFGSAGTLTTAAALGCSGLVLVDDAGYYAASPSQRKGANSIALTAGFTTAKVDVGIRTTDTAFSATATSCQIRGRKAVYAIGIGTEMLTHIPAFHADKLDYVSGDAELILNAAPTAGKTYTTIRIVVNGRPIHEVLTGEFATGEFVYELYADESNSTNLTNLLSALATALGITAVV